MTIGDIDEKKLSAIECTSPVEMDKASGGANSGYKCSQCITGFFKKDIGRVVGLHHPILETGFDEEGGAIKLPHTAQKREGGKRMTQREGECYRQEPASSPLSCL